MEKDTEKALEKVMRAHDSLTVFSEEQASRIDSLEGRIATMEDAEKTRMSDSGSNPTTDAKMHDEAIEENARLHESVGRLEERIAVLESPDHENEVIQKFLRDLDSDNYLEIGRKLGYLEETEASPEDLENVEGAEPLELPLGEDQVLEVQKEKPEDMTGWEYSETQGVYVRLKQAE